MTSKPQSVARRVLRDTARTATIHDLRIATDEEGLAPPDPAGNPEAYDPSPWTCVHLWVDDYLREADLSVRWCTGRGGVYQGAGEADDPAATYGDVSLRHVTRVRRADRARITAIIEVALAAAGRDPAAYSIGGDPR